MVSLSRLTLPKGVGLLAINGCTEPFEGFGLAVVFFKLARRTALLEPLLELFFLLDDSLCSLL